MSPIEFSIKKPVVVIVGIFLVVIFGFLGLSKMPYQLTPTVTKPVITVSTTWKGATPRDVEREIIEEQERALKGVDNLYKMESRSRSGRGDITLEFLLGTGIKEALLKVSNKLDSVSEYPENVDKPIINATGESSSPVVWMILKAKEGNPKPIETYRSYVDEEIAQYFERLDGVAELMIRGGKAQEMHIIIDQNRLVSHGITIGELITGLSNENVTLSAGTMDFGSKAYRIRTPGEFKSPEQIAQSVIFADGNRQIRLKDVAVVADSYGKQGGYVLHNGNQGIMIAIKPVPGSNIVDLSNAAEKVFLRLNEQKLADQGLYLEWIFDQRGYIHRAIEIVQNNILIGGALAMVVLFLFLRTVSSTIVVALAIPISVMGTFIVMSALGRSLNVVSMAGISFAVGMLVDSAIVVLENIDRHRKMGKTLFHSALEGTQEVVGAVVASILTTVAIFIPVIMIEQEAGQLFRDIALSATSALLFSMVVSILIIPMLSYQILRIFGNREQESTSFLGHFGRWFANTTEQMVRSCTATLWRRVGTISFFVVFCMAVTIGLFPKMEYLPEGNQNFVTNVLVPPPGYAFEEYKALGEKVYKANEAFMHTNGYTKDEKGTMPPIRHFFYAGMEGFVFFSGRSMIEDRAGDMIPQFKKTISSLPAMNGVSMQPGIFERGIGKGRTIDIDVSGKDLDSIAKSAAALQALIRKEMPQGTQIRPVPSIEMLYPELNFIPDSQRLKNVGLSPREFGIALDVLMDGRKIGEYKEEGRKTIDLVLKGQEALAPTPEALYESLIYTKEGMVPLSSLAKLERDYGLLEIRHFERERTITLQMTPPKEMALQDAMEIVEEQFVPQLKSSGALEENSIRLSGTADSLTMTRKALEGGFYLSILIVYLLMAALYGNFIYPLIIIFTVPLALAGGVLGLKAVNVFLVPQPLDILTMLGFIILVGTVVNNAILIVYQAINNVRSTGMEGYEAVIDATKTRLRPIYMSTLTSLFGMLPLVVSPGAGSEVYRGLGAVILGGLSLSTFLTVFVIPSLLMFVIGMEKKEEELV